LSAPSTIFGGLFRDPGETWEIPSQTPHRAEAGKDDATVLDLFAPPRSEWEAAEAGEPGPGRWPD
jgi:hypothetical protein